MIQSWSVRTKSNVITKLILEKYNIKFSVTLFHIKWLIFEIGPVFSENAVTSSHEPGCNVK